MSICGVNGCKKPVKAKNLCSMHYARYKKHGDTKKKLLFRGEPIWYQFWTRVKITSSCWIWTGSKSQDGFILIS